MMQRMVTVLMALALLAPAAAWTQQKGAVELKSIAEVETTIKNEKGEKSTKRLDAAAATKVPGDTVAFTTLYTNTGKEPATAVVIDNPVPEHTTYVDQSAEGIDTRIDFSVDNGKTYGAPDKLTIKDATGTVRRATAADYTNVRWTLTKPLAAGGRGSVSFKAKIK
jgi:uncharacterized repeat protein (TIGR01451 family)